MWLKQLCSMEGGLGALSDDVLPWGITKCKIQDAENMFNIVLFLLTFKK